jgi:hypothetical protein
VVELRGFGKLARPPLLCLRNGNRGQSASRGFRNLRTTNSTFRPLFRALLFNRFYKKMLNVITIYIINIGALIKPLKCCVACLRGVEFSRFLDMCPPCFSQKSHRTRVTHKFNTKSPRWLQTRMSQFRQTPEESKSARTHHHPHPMARTMLAEDAPSSVSRCTMLARL